MPAPFGAPSSPCVLNPTITAESPLSLPGVNCLCLVGAFLIRASHFCCCLQLSLTPSPFSLSFDILHTWRYGGIVLHASAIQPYTLYPLLLFFLLSVPAHFLRAFVLPYLYSHNSTLCGVSLDRQLTQASSTYRNPSPSNASRQAPFYLSPNPASFRPASSVYSQPSPQNDSFDASQTHDHSEQPRQQSYQQPYQQQYQYQTQQYSRYQEGFLNPNEVSPPSSPDILPTQLPLRYIQCRLCGDCM